MSGITNPAEEYFKDGGWGWDGSVWRKLPLLWGYSGVYAETKTDVNATVTFDSLQTTNVDAGEIWVITNIQAHDEDTVLTRIELSVYDGAGYQRIKIVASPAVFVGLDWQGHLVLAVGQHIYCGYEGTVANDNIHLHVRGYKMLIAA